jgi:hypothetical protein
LVHNRKHYQLEFDVLLKFVEDIGRIRRIDMDRELRGIRGTKLYMKIEAPECESQGDV